MASFASNILKPDAGTFVNPNLETQLAVQAASNPLARGSLRLARGRNERGAAAYEDARAETNALINALTQQEIGLARQSEDRQLLDALLSGVGSDGAQQLLSGVSPNILNRVLTMQGGSNANVESITQNATVAKQLDNLNKAVDAANVGSQAGVNPNVKSLEELAGVAFSEATPRSTRNAQINAIDSLMKAFATKTGNKTVTETQNIRGNELGSTVKTTAEETVGDKVTSDDVYRNTINSILGGNVIPATEADEAPLTTEEDITKASGNKLKGLDKLANTQEVGVGNKISDSVLNGKAVKVLELANGTVEIYDAETDELLESR